MQSGRMRTNFVVRNSFPHYAFRPTGHFPITVTRLQADVFIFRTRNIPLCACCRLIRFPAISIISYPACGTHGLGMVGRAFRNPKSAFRKWIFSATYSNAPISQVPSAPRVFPAGSVAYCASRGVPAFRARASSFIRKSKPAASMNGLMDTDNQRFSPHLI